MKKEVAIIYYSATGNTEAMAEACAVGAKKAGADVLLASVSEVKAEDIWSKYDHILLGCSAWGEEQIEQAEMKPFCDALRPHLEGKIMGIFGSCGWSRGAWLNSWYNELHFSGAEFPAPPLLAYGYPSEEDQNKCEKLGEIVAKA